MAYYNGWQTGIKDNVSPDTDWVVMCGTNAGSQLKLVNGVDVGTATGGTGGVSLWINGGNLPGEASDFAITELVAWPRGCVRGRSACLPPLGGLRPVDDARAVARLGGEQELVRRDGVRVVEVVHVEAAVPAHHTIA